MSDDEKTAALVMYLFAVLRYEEDLHPYGWYGWCTAQACAAEEDSLEADVWWALRFELEEPDPDWIGYVAFKRER